MGWHALFFFAKCVQRYGEHSSHLLATIFCLHFTRFASNDFHLLLFFPRHKIYLFIFVQVCCVAFLCDACAHLHPLPLEYVCGWFSIALIRMSTSCKYYCNQEHQTWNLPAQMQRYIRGANRHKFVSSSYSICPFFSCTDVSLLPLRL